MLQVVNPAEAGAAPVRADHEQRDEPVLQVQGNQVQGNVVARAGGVLDGELVAEEPVVALEHADEQVDRKSVV